MTSNSGGDTKDLAKGNEKPSTPTAATTSASSGATPTTSLPFDGQLSNGTTPQPSSPSSSQSSNDAAETLSPSSSQSSDATMPGSSSPKSTSSPNINIFDILSTAAQAIGLASAPATPDGSLLTRLSSATVSGTATPTPMSPIIAAGPNAPSSNNTSPTFGLGSAARPQGAINEQQQQQQRRLRRPGPPHRPQAYIPLELLPKVSLKEDPQVAMQEMMNGDPNSSCYPLPFTAADGRQALAVIPGTFLPGMPKPGASGQPATVTNRLIKLGKAAWRRYGWARTESLAGYGKETRPAPQHIEANIKDEEIDSYQLYNLQLETVTFIPQ